MEVTKFILLLHKKLKGEIGQQEQKELSDWLQREKPDGLAEGIEKAWNLSLRYKEHYEPDVDAGLDRLRARMAASAERGNGAGQRRPLAASRRPWRLLSAAAAAALVALAGWWWAQSGNASPEENAVLYTAGAEGVREVALPDGSSVLLNENSFLAVAADFRNASERRAELTGEAYFKVQPSPGRPFLITAGNAVVEVVGTAFNLRAYPGEGFTEVEVEEGKVRLYEAENSNPRELSAGQRGICRPGRSLSVQPAPGLNAHSWRTRRLEFRDIPLREALPALERHFQVKLKLADNRAADCGITMQFEDFSLDEVFGAFQLIFGMEVERSGDGKSFLLKGGGC